MAKKKSHGLLITGIVIVLVIALGVTYQLKSSSTQKQPTFDATTIKTGSIIQSVTATGDLQPVMSVDVSSQISGQIKEVLVDYNTPVKAGQILAQIDPATYEQRLKQSRADLASAEANNKLLLLNATRIRDLREKNLVSQQELDQIEAQLAQSNASLLTRQAAVEDAIVNLSRCTLLAPIDGIVMDRIAEKGKTVAASLNAPTLFTIVNDLAKMQINAAVAEADIGSVAVGQQVNFTVDAFPNRQFRGSISQIRNAPKTQQSVVTYQTIIDVSNADLKLKPGMTANVSIVVAERPNALRIPNGALRVRMPEELLPPKPVQTAKTPAAGDAEKKPLSEEEQRKIRREIMAEVGITRGAPPSPEAIQKAQQLAKERGIELDFSKMGGGRGGERGGPNAAPAVVSRTVYKLTGAGTASPKPEAVVIKLGISDSIYTEVLEGLVEGDDVVISVTLPGATSAQASAPSANPFSGGSQRSFGGRH